MGGGRENVQTFRIAIRICNLSKIALNVFFLDDESREMINNPFMAIWYTVNGHRDDQLLATSLLFPSIKKEMK